MSNFASTPAPSRINAMIEIRRKLIKCEKELIDLSSIVVVVILRVEDELSFT